MPYNFKLTIAYDGTGYCGWQIQPNGIAIQEVIKNKIAIILRSPVTVIGSGRTDSGVHAQGQVAHFHFSEPLDLYRFQNSLNSLLPPDIRILEISEAPLKFHAQHSAISKTYHYHLHLEKVSTPFTRLYSLYVREKINLDLLKEAVRYFLGTHNFTSFANEAHKGSAAQDAVRTMYRLDVIEEIGGVRLELEADGFLYKMVRNIVGVLLEVSSHKRPLNDIPLIFEACDRKRSGQAAPPQGLFLMQVDYPKCFSSEISVNDGK